MKQVILTGLREIPPASRLAEAIRNVLGWHESGVSETEAFVRIHQAYDEYDGHDWCHTISNAMIVAAALLYGQKVFGKTICLAVQTGFGTDCNGATAGSVVGGMLGEKQIPASWYEPYHRTQRTTIDGFAEVTVDELTEQTMKLLYPVQG